MTEPTNLTEKFAALGAQLAAQHYEVMGAIAALRGEGPENSLKSVNQSLWNIAGPAPGASLVDLLEALQAAANIPGDLNVAAILAAIGALDSNPAGLTVRDLLARIDIDIAGTSDTSGAESEPPFRCGLFLGDYIQTNGWEQSTSTYPGYNNIWYATYHSVAMSAEATVSPHQLQHDDRAYSTIMPGTLPRTICFAGTGYDSNWVYQLWLWHIESFEYQGYVAQFNSSDGVWSSGEQHEITIASCYRFVAIALTEGQPGPPPPVFWYIEGALG